MNNLLWLILGAPLFGAIFIVLFGRRLQAACCAQLATVMVFISSFAVFLLWCNAGDNAVFTQTLFIWMDIGSWRPEFGLTVDRVSLIMVTVASWIGFLIHLFSVRFMAGEEGERRYFFYLNLFVAGMLFFVMADNLILLYLGWEVMGLCSYALVSYYYHKQYYAYCGRKAFVVTRIGDTALAIAILVVFASFNTVNIQAIFSQIQTQPPEYWVIAAICLLLLVAGIAKSAQFPIHVWLPDAMTGPSTVSALIHAATMVTAGVYLLVRFHPLLNMVPDIRLCIAFIGCITAFFAASAALAQNEIKRILAYSTISQIGYMFAAVGAAAYSLALFHLIVHACFKALLFMSSGVIIKAYNGEGDIRRMGGLAKHQPALNIVYLIGCLTLGALPFVTSSFYSKDAIIAADFTTASGYPLVFLGFTAALFTSIYSMRMYFMVFSGKARSDIVPYHLPVTMKLPLIILAFLSIFIGMIQLPEEWDFGPHILISWLSPVVGHFTMPDAVTSLWLEVIGSLVAVIGIAAAYPIVRRELSRRYGLGNNSFLNNAWFTDSAAYCLIVVPYNKICWCAEWLVEKLLLHKLIINSVVSLLNIIHIGIKRMLSGALQRYLYLMVSGLVLIMFYAVWLFI